MVSQEPSMKQKEMLKLLLSLFKMLPLINKYEITNSYNVVFCKFLSVRKYGYSNLEQIYNVLGIFNEEGTTVSISCPNVQNHFYNHFFKSHNLV